jgi:superfamily II DNA/RNA helicase
MSQSKQYNKFSSQKRTYNRPCQNNREERGDDRREERKSYNPSKPRYQEQQVGDEEDYELTRLDSKENDKDEKIVKTFEELKLPENLLRGIYSYGFETPSRIQGLAIPPIVANKDVIAQSQAGTGKTGAFAIGVLSKIEEEIKLPQAIIMSNTRELADQINSVVNELSKYMNLTTTLCIGGISVKENIEKLENSQIIIGTPGRIKDLIDNKDLITKHVKILILDEADELLKKDFVEKTKNIIISLPANTQMCIFSATLPDFALELTKKFMNNPVILLIKKERLTLDMVKQYYIDIGNETYKYSTIADLYDKMSINQCIIFVNSVEKAEWLLDKLKNDKHNAEIIHGKLNNLQRIEIMKRFRKGEFRVLIATDLMCRGIDVQLVSYVINYDLPKNFRSYIHRIGRSGRYGKRGVAINFVTKNDYRYMRELEAFYKIRIEDMPDPATVNNILSS